MLCEETVEEDIDTTKLSEAELKDYMRQQTKPTIHTLKLVLKFILLDVSSFPFKSHSAVNIEASCVWFALLCSALSLLCLWLFGFITLLCLFVDEAWIRASLAKYGFFLEDFHLFVPDGASNGTKALKLPKALYRVCAAHDLQMSASHAAGNGSNVRPPPLSLPVSCTSLDPRCCCCALAQVSKNPEIKTLERKNSHIAARVHMSTKTTNTLQEVQIARGVPARCAPYAPLCILATDG